MEGVRTTLSNIMFNGFVPKLAAASSEVAEKSTPLDNLTITGPEIYFTIPVLGGLDVTETTVNSLIVTALIFVICLILTHKMEKIPTKWTQIVAEKLVIAVDDMVISTMGERNANFSPYIMTLMFNSILGSLIGLVGLRSTTADITTTLTWGVMTFVLIWACGIKAHGLKGQLSTLASPAIVMLPMNLIGELATPVSLGFRHFGNILSGMIISALTYAALGTVAQGVFGEPIPVFSVGIPAILSLYFDIFSGLMQAYIFAMLTMVYVSNANAPQEVEA